MQAINEKNSKLLFIMQKNHKLLVNKTLIQNKKMKFL